MFTVAKTLSVASCIALSLLVLGWSAQEPAGRRTTAVTESVEEGPVVAPVDLVMEGAGDLLLGDDCADCYECWPEMWDYYIAYELSTEPPFAWPGLQYYCPQSPYQARCDELLDCPIGELEVAEFVDRLEAAVATRDLASVKTLLGVSERILFVAERDAIQLYNCTGTAVVAQVTLPAQLTNQLN